ncbi:MAG: twin-arginine translocation signal domain-containing protein [Chloroflexi bacterium]|nr:twin-arginine translocation signal domain-containing protein [Chloroflexota bacterium]
MFDKLNLSRRDFLKMVLASLAVAFPAACKRLIPAEEQQRNSLDFIRNGKPVPFPTDTGMQPLQCKVRDITRLAEGNRPHLSANGHFIAFDKKLKGTYELHIMGADGFGTCCLTQNPNWCNKFIWSSHV